MATATQDMFVPGRCSFDSWCFTTSTTVPETPLPKEDTSSDFEFQTAGYYFAQESSPDQEQPQERTPPHVLALADELFCNGTLMPTSLRPPPRLRCVNGKNSPLSGARSTKSPTRGVLKVWFKRQSLVSADCDPFMAALENVKKENEGKLNGHAKDWAQAQAQPIMYDSELQAHQSGATENESPLGLLAEPKGVVLARQARLVKMGYEKTNKPKSKKHKIKKFLIRTMSVGRTRSNEHKQEDDNLAVTMKSRSCNSMATDEDDKDSREPETTDLALVRRQKSVNLLLCMGYAGAKYVK